MSRRTWIVIAAMCGLALMMYGGLRVAEWRMLYYSRYGVTMAGETWLNSAGEVIMDDEGREIVCDECPCDSHTCCECGSCCFSNQSRITLNLPAVPEVWTAATKYNLLRQGQALFVSCGVWDLLSEEYTSEGLPARVIIRVQYFCDGTNANTWSIWAGEQVYYDNAWQDGNSVWHPASPLDAPDCPDPIVDNGCCGTSGTCGLVGFDASLTETPFSATVTNNKCCKDTEGNCQKTADDQCPGNPDGECDDAP